MDVTVLTFCALFALATSLPANHRIDPLSALKRRLELSKAQATLNSNDNSLKVRQFAWPPIAQGSPVAFASDQVWSNVTQAQVPVLDQSGLRPQTRLSVAPQRGPAAVSSDLSQPVAFVEQGSVDQSPQSGSGIVYSDLTSIRRAPDTGQKLSQPVETKPVAQAENVDPRMKSRECCADKSHHTTALPELSSPSSCCDDSKEAAQLEEELKMIKTRVFQIEADINMEVKDLNKAISIAEAAERRLEEVTIQIVTIKEDIKWARLNAQAASRRSNNLLLDLGNHEDLMHDANKRINDEEIKMTNEELSNCRKRRDIRPREDHNKDDKYRESMNALACDRAIVKSEQDIVARLAKLSASAKYNSQAAIGRVRALGIDLENLQQDADVAARRVLQADAMRKKHEDCLCGKRDELNSLNQQRTVLEAKINARVKRDECGTPASQDKAKRMEHEAIDVGKERRMDDRDRMIDGESVVMEKEVKVDMNKNMQEAKELERKMLIQTESEMTKEKEEKAGLEKNEEAKTRSEDSKEVELREGEINYGPEIRAKREEISARDREKREEVKRLAGEGREDGIDLASRGPVKYEGSLARPLNAQLQRAPHIEMTSHLRAPPGRRRLQSPRRQANDTTPPGTCPSVPMPECVKQMASGQPNPQFNAIITGGKVQEDYARVVQERLAADSKVSGEIDEVLKAEQVATATQGRLREAVNRIERLKIAILATQEDVDKVKEAMRHAQARIDYHSKRKLDERQKLEKLYSDVTNIEINDCVSKETMKVVTKPPRPQDDDNGLMEKIMAAESLVKLQAIETARAERDFLLERRRLADIMNKMAVQVQDLQNQQADAVRAAQNARDAQDTLTQHDAAAYEARQKANCALGLEVDVEKYMAVHMACVSGNKKT